MTETQEHELEVLAARLRLLLVEASCRLEYSDTYGAIVIVAQDGTEVLL